MECEGILPFDFPMYGAQSKESAAIKRKLKCIKNKTL